MKNISEIDSNFKIQTGIKKDGIRFLDVNQPPFKVYGVFYENHKFRRMPELVAKSVSEGVFSLHANTAGGRVRFKTNSSYIAIYAKMPFIGKMPHFALTGSAGFDLYACETQFCETQGCGIQERYVQTFIPPFDIADGYESIIEFDSAKIREITINFPLYSEVSQLYIGISAEASVFEPKPYQIQAPIVYYGSSITQGGCTSRPGNAYESIVCRRLNADYVNLGFAGNAKGEDAIADYIKNLDMTAFVYDYDHNAPSIEHLEKTHEQMFQTIRRANPNLPIILMTRPKYFLSQDEKLRFDTIKTTYDNARRNGDRNVYLINGETLMELAKDEGTVDNCHPNDLGFASMAKAVGDLLEKII